MSKLLKLLDATKSPDQNVALLKAGGWIKGSEMTQEQYDMLREGDGRVRLTEFYSGYSDERDKWWQGGLRENGGYRIFDWPLRDVRGNLGDYYFIRFEDYVDGHLPPEPAGG